MGAVTTACSLINARLEACHRPSELIQSPPSPLANSHCILRALPSDMSRFSCPLDQLPPNAFQHIVLYLPDPGPFAATCRSIAAQLDQQALQLAWAEAWAPSLTGDSSVHRHPGYALLHWRRIHSWDMPRLVAVLLRWMERSTPLAASSAHQIQQLLETGDALAALQALLPHSQHLLLLYAAQAGHMLLLRELLARHGVATPVQLRWDASTCADCCLLLPAALAAVRGGHVDAMHMLLAAVAVSGACASAEQLADFHFRLLSAAIKGGSRSARCVMPLLQLCKAPHAAQLLSLAALPPLSNLNDSAANIGVLRAIATCSPTQAYRLCVHSGLVQLLPQLEPANIDVAQAASITCYAAGALLRSGGSAQLQHLAHAMKVIGRGAPAGINPEWHCVLAAAMKHNSLAALDAIWAAFAAPATAAEDRTALACCILRSVGRAVRTERLKQETVQWVVDHALPVVTSLAESDLLCVKAVQAAAIGCLTYGQLDWLVMFQAPDTTAALINQEQGWQRAQLEGQVHVAVRRGDAAAVQAALEPLQAHLAVHQGALHLSHLWVVEHALLIAGQLPAAATAEAVVRALTPFIWVGDDDVAEFYEVCTNAALSTAHGGALLRALCDASLLARARVAGPDANVELCWNACKEGMVDVALWLVTHPDQRELYLDNAIWADQDQPWNSSFTSLRSAASCEQLRASFTQLLHNLAGWRCKPDADASSSSERSGNRAGSSRPPPGARQLTTGLLQAVAYLGLPDMVHALLVFMDRWSPLTAHAE